jgi:RNA polymerase sigma factor (sigma-70 family)
MTPATDSELLLRYAETRDNTAFALVVGRHLDAVYSAALRRAGGDTHLAEDIAQQVFLALARQSRALATHPHLTAWLYATTRNHAANAVRAECRRKTREAEASAMNENEHFSPAASADWSQLAPILDATIDELSAPDRTAILLRYIEQKPFADIGEKLRITEDAARMRVDRALEKLRVRLARRGLASTSSALGIVLAANTVNAAPASLTASVAASATAVPATTAVIATLVTFMSTTKATLTLATLACLLAAGTATRQLLAGRSAAAALAADQKSFDALLAQNHRLKIEEEAAGQTGATSPAAPVEKPLSSAPVVEDPRITGAAFLVRHPEVKQALIERSRARIALTWAPFFKSEQFTPAQIERFIQLMLSYDWYGPGTMPGQKPMLLFAGDITDPKDAEKQFRDFFGDELLRKRIEFGRTTKARDFTQLIATALAFSPEPLTADQAARITSIIQSSKADKSSGAATYYDWDTIIAKSQGSLTAAQLDALDGMRAQDEYRVASTEADKRIRAAAVKKSTPASR